MLKRKMIRDIIENKLSYLACIIVIAIGIISYTSMSLAKDNLYLAMEKFYKDCDFAEGFARVKSMPVGEIEKIARIPGIDRVCGRLSKDVRVITDDKSRNVMLKLISVNPLDNNQLNKVKVIRGTMASKRENSLLLGDKFFTGNNFKIGDKITLQIEGRRVDFDVSGSGQSPEFIYMMRNGQDFAPDPQNYEAAFVDFDKMEEMFGTKGFVNDVSFTFKEGYTFKDIENRLKTELEPFQIESLVERKDQLSNAMLQQELSQLKKSAQSIPVMFFILSSIIIYIMIKRLVESQRRLLGVLMAFGFSKGQIVFHYLSYGIFIGIIGGVAGGAAGTALSLKLTQIYRGFFNLPDLQGRFSFSYFFGGITACLFFCIVAAYSGSRKIVQLKPVEALGEEVAIFKENFISVFFPRLWRIFTSQGQMALRNIIRNWRRSLFTLIGIMFAFSLMVVVFSQKALIDVVIMSQFTKVQKFDMKISMTMPLLLDNVLNDIRSKKGIITAEGIMEVPVEIKKLHLKKSVIAIGLKNDSTLYNVFDKDGNHISLPDDGVVISEQVAQKLGIGVGEQISFESPLSNISPVYTRVRRIIPQYLGANIYFDMEYLGRIMGVGNLATSVMMKVEQPSIDELRNKYKDSSSVGAIEVRQQTIDKYQKMIGASAYALLVMAVMAAFAGFAIIYNSSIISLAERKRELASLRVLGMTPREVLEVISFEQWTLGFFAILTGIPMAFLMNTAIAKGLSNDLYSMPAIIDKASLIESTIGTIIYIWIAMRWIFGKIKKFDLVEVLKQRE